MYSLSFVAVLVAVFISVIYAAPLQSFQTVKNMTPRDTAGNNPICGVPTTFAACSTQPESSENCNTILPNLYPSASSTDAPYSLSEGDLLQAIHLPPTFDASKPAVLLFPGTSLPTYMTFRDTLIRLLTEDDLNPVWINPAFETTQFSSLDAQTTAEYAAYSVGYISALTGQQVTVIAASQGSLNTQWALKYWPSTRPLVKDFIAISPEFHGTTKYGGPLLLGLGIGLLSTLVESFGLPPSAWQQIRGSAFERALSANGGNSAYVPTTSIWSNQDELIEPNDTTNPAVASQLLLDERGIGSTGFLVQDICRTYPAGNTAPSTGLGNTTYTHSGTLFHPLTYAVVRDAITHDGPASLERLVASGQVQRLCATQGSQDPRLPPDVINVAVNNRATAKCFRDNNVFTKARGEGKLRPFAYP